MAEKGERMMPRGLVQRNEEAWGEGYEVLRDFSKVLRTSDFKEIASGYPDAIWTAMFDAHAGSRP